MIKTTELMLGNIIEHDGKYYVVEGIGREHITISVGKVACELINPIPLTEGVLKRLGEDLTIGYKSVHEFQVARYKNPLNITPLLSPRYTTHDGVEVWEGDDVWYVEKQAEIGFKPHISKGERRFDSCAYFSTQQACQSYIDSLTRKPVFTTEDGVDVFEGDSYVAVKKSGYYINGDKSTPYTYKCAINDRKMDCSMYFSTQQLAQAYLNKVSAEKEYNDLMGKK